MSSSVTGSDRLERTTHGSNMFISLVLWMKLQGGVASPMTLLEETGSLQNLLGLFASLLMISPKALPVWNWGIRPLLLTAF